MIHEKSFICEIFTENFIIETSDKTLKQKGQFS